jgi:hypothetical protein
MKKNLNTASKFLRTYKQTQQSGSIQNQHTKSSILCASKELAEKEIKKSSH